MAIILWTAFAAVILLQTFGSIPTRVLGDELYAILAPAIFVGAIIVTVKGVKEKRQKRVESREAHEAAYVPPAGSAAAEIHVSVATPQELEQRERETRQRELNVQVNNIIENCKRVARNGVRKYDVPLDKDYKKEGLFSSGSTRTYDINCPHKYEDLRDELVRHGSPPVFLLISTHFTATLGIPLSSPALKSDSIGCSPQVKPGYFTSNLPNRLRTLYAQ